MRKHLVPLILAVAVVPVYAQTDSISRVLNPVEVTGSSRKEVTSSAPLHVVDQIEMKRSGITSVSDAIHRLPGVTLRDYGGAGGLKTVAVRGFGASHTGVTYDGIPLSDVQSGQIDVSRYSIDNVETLSMVIGDNDQIFVPARAAASPAMVTISTMRPDYDREVKAQLRFGSFGLINPYFKVGTPVSDCFRFNVIGEFTHADNDYPFTLHNGQLVTTERRTNSRMNSGHGEINLVCNPTAYSTWSSKVYYYDNSRRLPGPVIYYNNVSNERLHERNAFAQTRFQTTCAENLALMVNGKFNFASSLYHDENGKYPGGVLDQNYYQREYYLSGTAMYTAGQCWRMAYAADYFYNNLNSNLPKDARPYRHSILQSFTAKYGTKRLTAMARALYSIYLNGAKRGDGARDARRLSPSLNLSWQPIASQTLYLRASYKNILRMPTFSEAYFDHYGSKDIKPEITDQFNIGATYSMPSHGLLSGATFTADTYLNHVKDMIVAVPYNMFIWNMVNLGKVRIFGVDLTANLRVTPADGHQIVFDANYSYQRAMPRTDPASSEWMKQVAYIPRHSGNASIAYENPWCNLSVHATGVSDRYTTNANLPATRIDGYVECGATLYRHFGRLEARFDLLNMFDKQYYVVARYPMPGRSWQATLVFSF